MAKHTNLNVRSKGNELSVSQTDTDAPVLPIPQLEKLKEISPTRVEWVFDEMQREAEFRRTETRRVNTFVFIERIAGQSFGLLIGLSALGAAAYVATNGAPATGAVIGGTTVVGLVSAFLFRNKSGSAKEVRNRK